MKKSIIQDFKLCISCGAAELQNGKLHHHHCLHGIYRDFADKEGLWVWMCPRCHSRLHDSCHEMDRYYQDLAQRIWMKKHQKSEAEFREKCGKSFLL